ncbi:MAG: phosphoenolpyruvate carboxykinase (ATP), partial [Thermoplasmata archaeon]
VINEFAWQNIFVQQLFIRPTEEELATHKPEFTVVCTPNMRAIPEIDSTKSEAAIMVNFDKKIVMIVASGYAGEMKKSIFTIMNYLLPKKGIFPMHCSANVGKDGETALFFGLSGTGKTTLSADPNRRIIGDDEHGWTPEGIFNFEGGCYAKCIKLRKENEPQIWEAIKFGAVLENVIVDPVTRKIDFDDASLTENTRAAYPVEYIPGAVIPGLGKHPKTVIFLTADAFGVMPPIAKLTKEQAMYHFLSGYTSKLAGTERGITEPQATFSTCFGAPFMPMRPIVYAKMLGECITKHNSNVFLINTGWSGGPYGVGKRISIKHTRAMVTAALDGKLDNVKYRKDEIFNLLVPEECPGVPPEVLNPRNTWKDPKEYDKAAKELAVRFVKNFAKFKDIPKEIIEAGPKA